MFLCTKCGETTSRLSFIETTKNKQRCYDVGQHKKTETALQKSYIKNIHAEEYLKLCVTITNKWGADPR